MENKEMHFLDREPLPAADQQTAKAVDMLDPGLPKVGETVGEYALERVIHIGPMAVVYKALSSGTGAECAIKICRPGSSKAYRRAFILKRNLHARLNLGNVASFVTGGTWNEELPFSTSAFYRGRTLRQILDTTPELPPEVILAVGKILLGTLQTCCETIEASGWAGYLYRCIWSISPGNVMITREGVIRVLDIGLEQFFDDRLPLETTWSDLPPPKYSSTMDLTTIIHSFGVLYLALLYPNHTDYEALLLPSFLDGKHKNLPIMDIVRKCVSGKLGVCYGGLDEILRNTREALLRYSSEPETGIVSAFFAES